MSDPRENELRDETLALLLEEALPTAEPPADFTQQVLARRGTSEKRVAATSRRPSARARGWRLAVAMAAGVVLAVGAHHLPPWPSSGTMTVTERTEIDLGNRISAVAEPGARLAWESTLSGATEVSQPVGNVFYRVTHDVPFSVRTPGGVVTAAGTCFRVQVEAPEAPDSAAPSGGVVVEVLEGRVLVAHLGWQLTLRAGERARSATLRAPSKLVEPPLTPAATVESAAPSTGTIERALDLRERITHLEEENRSLRESLQESRTALAAEQDLRAATEGETIASPVALPARYQQEALIAAFEEAIAAAGVDGELSAIDCSEYPCILYGELFAEGDDATLQEALERLRGPLEASYPPQENDILVMAVSRKEHPDPHGDPAQQTHQSLVGITITPELDEEDPQRERLRKRIRFRHGRYVEATLAP